MPLLRRSFNGLGKLQKSEYTLDHGVYTLPSEARSVLKERTIDTGMQKCPHIFHPLNSVVFATTAKFNTRTRVLDDPWVRPLPLSPVLAFRIIPATNQDMSCNPYSEIPVIDTFLP